MKKQKVYVLMISRVFPAYHPNKGENTYFRHKILLNMPGNEHATLAVKEHYDWDKKIHTIRENYDLWARRAEKINRGEAVLSLRQWTGSPYNYKRDGSKPVEFMRLEKISVQRFGYEAHVPAAFIDGGCKSSLEFHFSRVEIIAKNDGLSFQDFKGWFPKSVSDCALIQFTDFKY